MSDEEPTSMQDVEPAQLETDTAAISKCPDCGHGVKPNYVRCPKCEGARNRDQVDRLAEVIGELRERPPRNPQDERNWISRLSALGHPFAKECVAAFMANESSHSGRL